MEPTGNSRRQSYRYAPTSRMTNTFIDHRGMITKKISYLQPLKVYMQKRWAEVQVNPVTGEFNFAVAEGYLIKTVKLTNL